MKIIVLENQVWCIRSISSASKSPTTTVTSGTTTIHSTVRISVPRVAGSVNANV